MKLLSFINSSEKRKEKQVEPPQVLLEHVLGHAFHLVYDAFAEYIQFTKKTGTFKKGKRYLADNFGRKDRQESKERINLVTSLDE